MMFEVIELDPGFVQEGLQVCALCLIKPPGFPPEDNVSILRNRVPWVLIHKQIECGALNHHDVN